MQFVPEGRDTVMTVVDGPRKSLDWSRVPFSHRVWEIVDCIRSRDSIGWLANSQSIAFAVSAQEWIELEGAYDSLVEEVPVSPEHQMPEDFSSPRAARKTSYWDGKRSKDRRKPWSPMDSEGESAV